MNSVEDRAREGLHRLAEPVESRLAVDDVLRSGERRRRQRRAAFLASGAAGVAAVLTAVAIVPGLFTRDTVPAVPAPMSTTSAATPSAGTPSELPTTVPDGTVHDISVDIGSSIFADVDYGLRSVSGTAKAAGDGWDVTFDAVTKKGAAIHRTGHATGSAPAVAKITDRVWVVVSPSATWLRGTLAGGGIAMSEQVPFNSVPLIEYLVATGNTTGKLNGFLWRDVYGTVWDDRGTSVSQATFTVGEHGQWYTQDERLAIACGGTGGLDGTEMEEEGCAGLTAKTGGGLNHKLIPLGYGSGSIPKRGSAAYKAVQYGVLPTGASGIGIDLARKDCAAATGELSTGGPVAFVITCPFEYTGTALYTEVRYTDAAGTRVALRP